MCKTNTLVKNAHILKKPRKKYSMVSGIYVKLMLNNVKTRHLFNDNCTTIASAVPKAKHTISTCKIVRCATK